MTTMMRSRAFADEKVAHSVGRWCRAAIWNDAVDESWCARNGVPLQRAASEGVNTQGGFLVPTPMLNAIISLREQRGVFRRAATVINMSSDTAVQARRTGGLTAVFSPEAATVTETAVTWDNITYVAKKLMTLTRVSNELSEDAIGLAEQITSEIAYAFASKEDDCGFNGDGTQGFGGIRGLTQLIVDGAHDGSKQAAAATHNTILLLDLVDLTNALGKLPSYALDNARWYISVRGFATCFCRLAGAGGGIGTIDVGGRRMPSFLGLPVEIANVLPNSTATFTSQVMLLVGDLSLSSTLASRRDVSIATALTRFQDTDQIGIRGTERIDAINHDVGDQNSAGPIIGLTGTA
jgi:HK97 family phage major capsid protein